MREGPRRARLGMVAGALAAFALVSGGAASCATTTKNSPDQGGSGSSGGSAKKTAKVGDAITLQGNDNGSKLRVRVVRVVRHLKGGQYDQPQTKGNHFAAVIVSLTNTGSATYKDSPSNGAKLITSTGEPAETALLSGGSCGSQFSTDVTLSHGDSEKGCLAFELKPGAKPKRFQFALDSGFGPQTGEWKVR